MNSKDSERLIAARSFFWNAAYSGLGALQSAILLFAISRTRELSEAGIITMGFALALLVSIVGGYGIRNFQVTDVEEEYSFSDYFHLRMITSIGSLLIAIIYLVVMMATGKYSTHKAFIILEIVLLKMVDAVEGLYIGRLQQRGRFDVGSMIAAFRMFVSTLVIFVLIWVCDNLHVCFAAGLVIAVVLDLVLLPKANVYADYRISPIQIEKIKKLLIYAFPICLGLTLHNYIGNGPKYLVDLYMTDGIQAISGYVMMPMFVITVLNGFLMQPTVKSLGDAWNGKEHSRFKRMIARHFLIMIVLSLAVLVMGIFLGLPLLSLMYNVELGQYRTEFSFLMVGGTLYTLSAYMIVLLTTIRRQREIAIGCIIAVLTYVLFGKGLVQSFGLLGASYIYIIANLVMLIFYAVSFMISTKGLKG